MIPVIAVSGYPGSGKTSLVRALARNLPGAAPLFMDSYERMTRQPIGDIARWLRDGADIDAFDFPGLSDDLAALKNGLEIRERPGNAPLSAQRHVVFETQFGRAHADTGRHIDVQVWIDVPFDIALARNLKAFTAGFLGDGHPERRAGQMQWLDTYLGNYLETVRALLEMQLERVGRKADVILDGRTDPAAMLETALAEIGRRLP
jgi:uridine kinase